MEKYSLNVWTTKLAIGSVWLVAIFLIICGFENIFHRVEQLIKSETWTAIVAVPVLVISYMIGAIVIHLSNMISTSNSNEIHDFIFLSKQANDTLALRYEETRHELEFIQASMPTLAVLSLSVIWGSIKRLDGAFQFVSIMLAILTIASIYFLFVLVNRLRSQLQQLARNENA